MTVSVHIDDAGIHAPSGTNLHFAHQHTLTQFDVTADEAGVISPENLIHLAVGLWTITSSGSELEITHRSPLKFRKGHHDFEITVTKDGLLKVSAAANVKIYARALSQDKVSLRFVIVGLSQTVNAITALKQNGISALPNSIDGVTWARTNSRTWTGEVTIASTHHNQTVSEILNRICDLTITTDAGEFTIATSIAGTRYRPQDNPIAWVLRSRKVPRYSSTVYRTMRALLPIRKNTYFFQSYLARSLSCSPRAMYDFIAKTQPNARLVWSLNDINVPVHERTSTVRPGSIAHYYYLATAKYVVSNTGLADGFDKRKGQIHLQTWHGSTLKRIGRDKGIDDSQRKIRGGVQDPKTLTGFARRVSMWDFLLVANSLSAESHLTAWRFDGEMLHTGYPRNDSLFDPEWNRTQRESVRRQYNIPDDHTVALWAPTWRDDAPTVNGRLVYQLPISLIDVAKTSKLTILAKMHYKVSNLIDDSGLRPTLINVSDWNDVNDLFPASDVLISDFSGTIPDYANTGKPIVFYIPDYDEYMETRGTYFDIPTQGPGPLVRTENDLFAALTDLTWVAQYESRYAHFREVYGEYDDGHATQRAVERMLDPTPARRNGKTTFK